MTAISRSRPGLDLAPWVAPLLLVGGLGVVVGVRGLAVAASVDAILAGAAFGAAMLVLAVIPSLLGTAGPVLAKPRVGRGEVLAAGNALALGVAFGLALVAITVLAPALTGRQLVPGLGRPPVPFEAWAAVTVLVATAEEILLRGVLLDRVARLAGIGPAIVVTSLVFGLMHVPLYGWHVVPLDVAVGLGLAGLRLTTRGIIAPAAAHAVADLATWWL